MLRPAALAFGLLLVSWPAFGQATTTEPQTLQALLTEIRQLRQDLQIAATAARRAQILIYRLHVQEAAVARASQRLDEAKMELDQLQRRRRYAEFQIKRNEESRDRAENPAQRKQFEDAISELKSEMEESVPEEQNAQVREMELDQQLRIEQAKLDQLQDQLDRLDTAVMNAALSQKSGTKLQ
jgi:chromosome segregation ATPase